MDGLKAFELKVGIFVMIGIAILFIIVFSIGDINLVKVGYRIHVRFNYAAGIGPSAPVRLAGVGVGHLESVHLVYDPKEKKSMAQMTAWIQKDTRIEEDSEATINTLGLLGEKYLEIFPGTPGKKILVNNDTIVGHDPIPMEKFTENLTKISNSVAVVVERLQKGEGTIGKLLTEDQIYKNLEAFTEDIRKHPWKLLNKPRGD